jgi:signal transduction histidine kinase
VLSNLVNNAVRHTPGGVAVRIEADVEDDVLCLRVIDEGPGIPPERRAELFEPHGGRVGGLGLAIVGSLARTHGGEARLLDVERGTAVEVRLPRGRTRAAPPDRTASP